MANLPCYMNTLIAMPLRGSAQGQFSRITALPGNRQIINLKEVQLIADRTYGVLALTGDQSVYQLFGGVQDGTITSTAVTQPLPTKSDCAEAPWTFQMDKVFQELYLEGDDLPNFVITAFDDYGVAYGPWQLKPKQHTIQLGAIESKQLVLQFVHSATTVNVPQLSAMTLKSEILGTRP